MKNLKIITTLIPLGLLLFVLTNCGRNYSRTIDRAYGLVDTDPDSALALLSGISNERLGHETARYALVFTIAQDKSGWDVDDDSLLHVAYAYYGDKPDDSLYAKCQYYMGKYYMLNDSTEKAIDCFQKSIKAAQTCGDLYIQCLGLEKLSKIKVNSEPLKAIAYAKEADRTYASIRNRKMSNSIYYKMNVSLTYMFADSLEAARKYGNEALAMAVTSGDSNAISNTCQNLSVILRKEDNYQGALENAIKACEFNSYVDNSKTLNLAWAYLNTGSIDQCKRVLKRIGTNDPAERYLIYYLRHRASMKEHNYGKACEEADSAYFYIEKMYGDQLVYKEKYYESFVKSQYEKGITEGRARFLTWLLVLLAILSFTIIAMIVYSYRQYKSRVKMKILTQEKEKAMKEKMHKEEIRHKEIQITTMRRYLLKKIDTAEKIDKLRGNRAKPVVLTDEDWEEIRLFVDNIEGDFVTRLQQSFPTLSNEDIKFMMLLRLGMSAKAMGLIYGISEKSIRQRLFVYKAKVGIDGSNKGSLRDFIATF